MHFSVFKLIVISFIIVQLNGCSFYVSTAKKHFGKQLTQAILNHDDPQTIATAIPAYLILLESLIIGEPDDETLLASASTLYISYIGFLPNELQTRKEHLTEKALNYAIRSACIHDKNLCFVNALKYEQFENIIKKTEQEDLDALYTLGVAWAGWIQAHTENWNAIAQLAQVKAIMTRVIELDNDYKKGSPHAYLGVLATILPPALGGVPDIGKQHFDHALQLSEEKNLMIKVIYAKQYARMMFNRELHDNLLNEVINAKLEQPDLTLMNALAKKQAQNLLDSADEYF